MLDALPTAIYATDAQGRLTYFNPACIQLSGRTPILGTDHWCVTWKLYHPDGKPMPHEDCPMAVAIKEGRPIRGAEAIAERPDGTRIWFMPFPTPLRDDHGKVIGGINMLVDITQRKQSELAQANLAAIVESSDDAIISKNLDSIITSWNQGAQRLFGYTAQEAIGNSITMLMPPERMNEEPGILERIRRGEKIDHYETLRRRKDGTLIDVSLTVSPLRDAGGTIVGASKIARDITERRRQEDALRLLAALGFQMITADEPKAIYGKIVDAAATLMHSDFASMQLFHPDRGEAGELELLGHRGFDPEGVKFWQWVSANSTCVCGLTLRAGSRVVVADAARDDRLDHGQKAAYSAAGISAMQSTPLFSRSGKLLGMISTHWRRSHQPAQSELSNFDILARQAADILERNQAERSIRQNEAWLAAQKEALQSALDAEPLEKSLGVLVRGAVDRFGPESRAAFYRANADGATLHHVVGMHPEYARIVDGFPISLESFACGLAAHTRSPILTADVKQEPRWKTWLPVAEKFDFRGCWSFPLYTPGGQALGSFALYWRQPRAATNADVAFAGAVADTASIIISRHLEASTRLQAEEGLRESEQQLSAMFAQAGVGVVMLRADDCMLLRVNPTYCQIVGYSEQELIGKSCLDLTHPDDLPEVQRRLKEMLSNAQRTATIEKRYVRKDGRHVWVRVNLAQLADRDRRRAVAMVEDITEQHMAAVNLARAKEEAETASIAKDNFLATLSHELRTPLTPVLATLSSWEARRSFPQELADDLAMVRRNVDLEARLIDDLLDLTRIAKGKIALNFEVLDVQRVLHAVIAMYQSDINGKRITLSVRLEATQCYVRGDPGRLQQVFWNILKNAVKFTPERGKIDVCLKNDQQGSIHIIFTDNGAGISESMLPRLFQPFEQETAGRYGGLGLGLAITKKLLEAQQGAIEAKSDGPGKGASFIITLPCVSPPLHPVPASAAPGKSDREFIDSGYRVLLVEDHADTARVLSRLLIGNGHTVTTAYSIADALEALRVNDFDILVSDIGLPDGTGIDLIRSIRDELLQKLPAIALTGFGMDDDIKRTLQAGFNDHLTKPVNFARLEQTIRRACTRENLLPR
jgi:PAS domain S-box-containing protein